MVRKQAVYPSVPQAPNSDATNLATHSDGMDAFDGIEM
jgi:hypothetical protein